MLLKYASILGEALFPCGLHPFIVTSLCAYFFLFIPRFKSELGTVQEWYLINGDPNLGHPIHIHVNHFQVRNDWLIFSAYLVT